MGGKNRQSAQDSSGGLDSQSASPVPTEQQHTGLCPEFFGLRVEDETGAVVKDIGLQLKLSDGQGSSFMLSAVKLQPDGSYRTAKVLPRGNCEVSFPALFDAEWWPKGEKPKAEAATKALALADGDCAVSVADKLGFRDYHTFWDCQENSNLRTVRPNANQLLKADSPKAPDKKSKVVKKATNQVWTFVVKTKKPASLRVVLVNKDGKPVEKRRWELKLSAKSWSGVTKQDGLIEIKDLPPQETAGTLKVKLPPPAPPAKTPPAPPPRPEAYPPHIKPEDFKDKTESATAPQEWDLKIGALPPQKSGSGVQARLHNFGFGCDVGSDAKLTSRAVKAYQRHFMKNRQGSGKPADIQGDVGKRHDDEK